MMKKFGTLVVSVVFFVLLFTITFSGCRKSISSNNLPENPSVENPVTPAEPNPPQEEVKPVAGQLPEGLYPQVERQIAPEFDLPRLDGEGNLSLSSLKGKLVLIDFTTTWCIWCTRQEPQVEDLFKKYESKGFTVIAIDCREPKETVLSKYPGGKSMYPVLLDEDGNVSSNQFGVKGYPFYLLIDQTGKVAYVQSGFKENMFDSVSKIIDYLLDKEI